MERVNVRNANNNEDSYFVKDISPKKFLRLYLEYIQFLSSYFVAEPSPSERAAKQIVSEYLENPMSDIIPIFAGTEEPAGFLIVCRRGGDCHLWADYFIAQLFVRKEHRIAGHCMTAISLKDVVFIVFFMR